MACREYRDTLSAYMDDELKPLTRLRVEAHLRGCSRCRRQLRQTRRATEMVRGLERVEAPPFAARRAHTIALGSRARGWERLRGGLSARPQTLPLKPVLLAGLAFVMVLVLSQTFDTVVAPRMGPQTATHTPQTLPSTSEAAPGLPGTLSADRLTDSQKAEIARRVLEAHPEEITRLAQAQEPPAAAKQPEADSGAQPAARDALPQAATAPSTTQPEPVSVAQAAPETYQPLTGEALPVQGAGEKAAPEETRIAAALSPQPAAALIAPRGAPTTEGTVPTPAASADVMPAPGSVEPGQPIEILDLGQTFRQVLVLAQHENGEMDAAFYAADASPSGTLRRFDEGASITAMEGEGAGRVLEDLPPPEPDPDTGIAPPLPIYRPAPALRRPGRGQRDLGPLSPALLRVNVLADGTVGSLALLTGSGLRWLDRAVVQAVRAWEFRPAERLEQAVPVSIELLVEFELE